jgi:copper chaperone CopZ
MKKIFFLLFAVLISVSSFAQFTSARLTAAGLTCAMCTKAINNALQKIPFVKSVDADIANSAFLITFRSGGDIDPDRLKSAVEEAGFSVASLGLTGSFNNIAISNDAHVNIMGKTFHFVKVKKAVLNGSQTLTVVDKKFLPAKSFKIYSAATGYKCIQTGTALDCCPKTASGRIYHVTI